MAIKKATTTPKERVDLALDASYEIEMIAKSLLTLAQNHPFPECGEFLVRGMAIRLVALSGIVTFGLQEENVELLRDMRRELTGVHEDREEVEHA